MSGRARGRSLVLVAVAVVAGFLVAVGAATPAWACEPGIRQDPVTGTTYYDNCQGQNGDDGEDTETGTGGGGGSSEPTCEFTGIWDQFCRGSSPCYKVDPANLQDEDYARELNGGDLAEKPSEDDHLIFVSCLPPGGERQDVYFWSSEFEEGVSTRDRLLSAYAALPLPDITPVYNPPNRTLVNLDTWWWAEGASTTPIVGPEALGLVAIAEPSGMTVTAAGQTVTCPVVATRSDTCSMIFRRAGDYTAEMTVSYTIRFELNGQAFPVPAGNEDVLTASSTEEVDVVVREVQSRVTKTR